MNKKLKFLIIDGCKKSRDQQTRLIADAGHDVTALHSCDDALNAVEKIQPDCIICELLLPGMHAPECLKRIRKHTSIKQPTFIILSDKQYDNDKKEAIDAGVDAYFKKPINEKSFLREILDIMDESIKIKFWGVRGSLAVPGKKTAKHGGNTNCITITISSKHNFILDAGTGIKELSNDILKRNQIPYKANILLTHPHYDHINGIPFFVPLYMRGNSFTFYGPDQDKLSLKKWLSMQMDSIFFPINMSEFLSSVSFKSLTEERLDIDGITFETMYLNHPGYCLGYKLLHNKKIICYITDNELYFKNDIQRYNKDFVDRLISFVSKADILIIDSTYTDEEYKYKIGWGHSPLSNVIDLAHRAKVQVLCLHHHDPDQDDKAVDMKLKHAQNLLNKLKSKTKCIAPCEGDEIIL